MMLHTKTFIPRFYQLKLLFKGQVGSGVNFVFNAGLILQNILMTIGHHATPTDRV